MIKLYKIKKRMINEIEKSESFKDIVKICNYYFGISLKVFVKNKINYSKYWNKNLSKLKKELEMFMYELKK